MSAVDTSAELPLFPLKTVLFPGGLLGLKVFEARYVDLVSMCLREQRPFGVVALRAGREAGKEEGRVQFETTGTLAELIEVDSERPGILNVRCRGTQRFVVSSSRQQDDGLWLARVQPLADDALLAPSAALIEAVRALASTIASLKSSGKGEPFLAPHHFDQAGWVANRWCEILPISLAARQKLMELADPLVRLQLVDEFLRSRGVVK